MVVRGGIGQIDLQRPVVDGRHAERRSGRLVLLRRVLPRVALLVERKPGELGAADDLEEDRLVLAGGDRIAGALHRVAEVLRGQRRAVAVLQPLPQVEGDLGGILVVLPRLCRSRNRLLIGVEAGQALVGKGQDIDLVGEGALLRIDDVRIDRLMNAKDLAFVLCS